MSWQTPKTNWNITFDSEGNYAGDYFNATDFNRIKNNLEFLHDLAIKLYDDFEIVSIGNDKTISDYFYADEIEQMIDNLITINENTLQKSYGNFPSFSDNGHTIDFITLNRIENAILDLYLNLNYQMDGHRTFIWNFGIKGGF